MKLKKSDVKTISKVNGIRTKFQADKEKIVLSRAFRRLKHKTHMIWKPKNDYVRTRLTHVLEVSLYAQLIASNITPKLDLDLVECIALAHDIGHPPFGHAGERALNKCLKKYGESFSHAIQGRILAESENLKLSEEILDGIEHHEFASRNIPKTREGQVVRYADVISSINSNYEDVVGLLIGKEISMTKLRKALNDINEFPKERINVVIKDIINNSQDKEQICMGTEMKEKLIKVIKAYKKLFMSKSFSYKDREAEHVITRLFVCFMKSDSERRINFFGSKVYEKAVRIGDLKAAIDHISSMTDDYAWEKYCKIFAPIILDYYW